MRRRRNLSKELLGYLAIIANICTVISFIGWIATGKIYLLAIIAFLLFVTLIILLLRENLPFDEIEVKYNIEVVNKEGDAFVQRDTRFVNNSKFTLIEREHLIFSTSTPSKWDDLKLEAWDNMGNKLGISCLRDDPTLKRFIIKFAKALSPKEPYFYGYKYFWSKYLPKADEALVAQDVCYIDEFIVKVPKDVMLQRIACEELFHDGRRECCEELERDIKQISNRVTEYRLKVVKKERFNKVELLLTFEKQGV